MTSRFPQVDERTGRAVLDLVHGCTFDDFILAPQHSVLARRDPAAIDLSCRLSRRIRLERPIVSANMLSEMEGLSESLQTRVRDATSELRKRNAEIEEMYQRVFDLREALAKAEQLAAVGQAAANVAHQVGTPLNLVSGYVQVLLSDPSLDTRTRRRLEMMQRQIEQVTLAVRGLLDRARRTVQRARVEPAALIDRVLEIAQPRLDRNHGLG